MKLIKPSYEILEQKPGIEGIYEAIERAGRTCYKSTRKEGTTAKDFVDRMIASKHYAMLEHGTVYLLFSECCYHRPDGEFIDKYTKNPYSKVVCIGIDDDLVEQTSGEKTYLGDVLGTGIYGNALYAITTNYRVLVENGWLDDLKYLCEPTEYHEKRVTVRFTSNIHFYKDITRHRRMSFAIESTRYCNYSKDQFNNELTFIIPSWIEEDKIPRGTIINHDDCGDLIGEYYFRLTGKESPFFKHSGVTPEMNFAAALQVSEQLYLELVNQGWQPQQAAEVLPQATKADIVTTGFVSDWEHFFRLRTSIIAETGKPHPDIAALVDLLYKEFIQRGYINEIK